MSDDLQAWIGRSQSLQDIVQPTPAAALNATLDHEPMSFDRDTVLPPLWHGLYSLPLARASQIGPDGHPRRSGQLVFVKVRHELFCNGGAEAVLVEFHDIVYRDTRQPGDVDPAPQAAPSDAQGSRELLPDEVLLFRHSALTFNGHRIHHDRPHATDVEGYPGLVVHGPLIATLLLDLVRRQLPEARVASLRFRALRPTFDGRPMRVNGRLDGTALRLWAQDHEGWLTMDATATLA